MKLKQAWTNPRFRVHVRIEDLVEYAPHRQGESQRYCEPSPSVQAPDRVYYYHLVTVVVITCMYCYLYVGSYLKTFGFGNTYD